MFRCIELGKNGLGTSAPNPMVGCVIIHEENIIGEGYTSTYGGPHAEVNAINSVKDKSLLSNSTLYVTLEPCAHFGKTPPCVNLILEYQIPKVVIGIKDPNTKVAGKSIKLLKDVGCKVIIGVLENEVRKHHKRFLTFQEKNRPYIILKWAETQDGFIAPENKVRNKEPKPFWITNAYSKQLVHKWRAQEQAILVGTTTALADNPKLTIRNWEGQNPTRIIIDKNLKIPPSYHIFDDSTETIVITAQVEKKNHEDGITHEVAPFKNLPQEICDILHKHNINSVLIEGGTKTLQSFIDANLWDEARVFKGQTTFLKGVRAPEISSTRISEQKLLDDKLMILWND